MRITVLKLSFSDERSPCLQQLDDCGIGFEYGLALIFRQALYETAVIVKGRIGRETIFLTYDEVFGAMPGSRVHDAATLLERDVLAENSGNHAVEKRMLELGAGERIALKWLRN